MKKLILIILLLLPVHVAYGGFDVPHVQVLGVAEKLVVPDEIHWTLTVKSEAAIAKQVADSHVVEVGDVLGLLYKLGQNNETVTTSNMQMNENWVYRDNARQKQGYFASTTIRFKSNDFSTYVDYWTKLSALKSVSVARVAFAVSNRSEIEDDVKVLAIAEAKKKAARFAKALDAELGPPLQIEERGDANFTQRQPVRAALMESDSTPQPVSPGTQVIEAQVKVVFSIN